MYDWIRELRRAGHDVAGYTLREGIMPKDHAMFEQYWIGQFADLLNAAGIPPAVAATSTVGKQVIAAVQAQIERARTPPLAAMTPAGPGGPWPASGTASWA